MKILSVLFFLLIAGCAPGTVMSTGSESSAARSGSRPTSELDLLIAQLFRHIESEEANPFAALVALDGVPARAETWNSLNAFLLASSDIKYEVIIRKRIASGADHIYAFRWKRKNIDVKSGQIVEASGDAEWTFSRETGRWLLKVRTGDEVF